MELRGKLTDIIGTREGEGSGLVTCRHLFDSSVILGDIPVPGTVLITGPSTAGKEFGGCVLSSRRPSPSRLYARSISDLTHTPDLHSVQPAGYVAGLTRK